MTSRQEHEAWDVLLACQGQLRLAPSGQVIGVEMNAALKLATARGYSLAVLSELLPVAEGWLGRGVEYEDRVNHGAPGPMSPACYLPGVE